MVLVEQRLAPLHARADALCRHSLERLADVEEGVERTADLRNPDARHPAQPLRHEVAPLFECLEHLGDALLRASQRRDRRVLADAAGVARLLALQVADRLRERLWGDRPADSPAGHGVGLAHTGHHDRAVGKPGPQRGERDARPAVVDELVVDLVGNDGEILLDRDVGEAAEFSGGVDDARGVAWGAEQEHPRLGRDGSPQGLRAELEVLLDPCLQKNRLCPGEFDEFRVAHPVGRGNDHLIPLVEHRGEHVVEGVLGAVGDHDLRRRDGETCAAAVVVGHGLFELRDASGRGVFRLPGANRLLRGPADMGGRGEVGLAHGEVDDVDPGGGHRGGAGGHRQRGRRLEGPHAAGGGEALRLHGLHAAQTLRCGFFGRVGAPRRNPL